MTEIPKNICGYPIPGWRLERVEWSEIQGQPNGWIVSLKREHPDAMQCRVCIAMARSDLGPLEAWEEANRIALRADKQPRDSD